MVLVVLVALLWLAVALVVGLSRTPRGREVDALLEREEPLVRPLVLHRGGRGADAA